MDLEKDWMEIKQGEYRRIKRDFPETANGITARIGHKFFKRKINTIESDLLGVIERLERVEELADDIETIAYEIRKSVEKLKGENSQ